MTTTADRPEVLEVPTVNLDTIHDHPANPRRDAVADDDLVASVLAAGIHQPLIVAPAVDGDGWVLIDGHRRKNAATRAGLTRVPVSPRYDLVTDAQQIEVMAVTGLTQERLTPVEEAAAYEQLMLAGFDEAAIAAATGFSKRRVQQRLKINGLSTGARDAVHAGEVTLTDIAALEEFEDDHELYAQAERALGSPNFRSVVHALRSRRERAITNAETITALEALGAVRVRSVPGEPGKACRFDEPEVVFDHVRRFGSWTGDLGDPAVHEGHLGWALDETFAYATPDTYCLDTTVHPEWQTTPPTTDRDDAEWLKQQAAREAERERVLAANAARQEWLTGHLTGLFPTKSHQALAALAGPFLIVLAHDQGDEPPADLATPTKTLAAFAAWLAGDLANLFTDAHTWVHDRDDAIARLQLWDWLKGAGYPMSDLDVEWRTRLETRLTELDEDAEDTDG